jgi:Holliday junction resolvase
MRYNTFCALEAISRRWPIENGKIIQLLLGICLSPRRAGFAVMCHLSEGVDLELIRAIQKFAIEVKTTEGTQIALAHKDVTGLRAKSENDGYIPAVAALPLGYSSDWIVCNAQRLTVGKYTCSRLALDSMPELEVAVKQHFEKTVSELKEQILRPPNGGPLTFLNGILISENMPAVPVEVLQPVSVA